MTDYGREVRFGYFLVPNVADPLVDTAQEVERLGLDGPVALCQPAAC